MRFEEYIEKHLVGFVKEELDNGYSLNAIKKALLSSGHHSNAVDSAVFLLKSQGFQPMRIGYEPRETLDQKMLTHVVSMLSNYIKYQVKQGYEYREIGKVLLRAGHSREAIDKALVSVIGKKPRFGNRVVFPCCLIALIFILIATSISVDEPIFKILFAFSPSILTLVFLKLLDKKLKKLELFIPAILFAILFFALGKTTSYPLIASMAILELTILNLLIALVFSLAYILKR